MVMLLPVSQSRLFGYGCETDPGIFLILERTINSRVALDGRLLTRALAFVLLFLTGLAITRLLYEVFFSNLLWLGRPAPVFFLALLFAGMGLILWHRSTRKMETRLNTPLSIWVLTPLLLNLVWIFNPTIDLVGSRFTFAASLWLTAIFIAQSLFPASSWRRLGPLFIAVALLPIYLLTIPQVVGSADTFEFQVVIPQLGIAHPTGYPLYILLGRLFSFIPFGSVAWRVNLASAVFAFLAVNLLYATSLRLLKRPLPALFSAVLLGLTPVFWSQAVEAEVYALHALIFAAGLWLIVVMLESTKEERKCTEDILAKPAGSGWQRLVILMALLLGLGLTNHLTTLFLLPPAILAVLIAYGTCIRQQNRQENLRLLLKTLAAFILPLLLYAYLPLRWSALQGEPMGLARFVDWVIGGRFQDALQLTAWLTSSTRYQVVGRLLLQNWGLLNLALAGLGLLTLLLRRWRLAVVLLLAWLGFVFYALNYIVPDLSVFIIPAHVVTALLWGAGVTAVLAGVHRLLLHWNKPAWQQPLEIIVLLLLLLPSLLQIKSGWPTSYEEKEKLLAWGKGVLAMPLNKNAAVLADSEKIAPLYYLQQAEGLRPDLAIMVLPDEAAYRSELDTRLAAGQTVYLARFLPGLEGIYHLRSFGPLLEVSTQALDQLPQEATPLEQTFGPLKLIGYSLQEPAAVDPSHTAVTLFWTANGQAQDPLHIYMRWAGDSFMSEPDVKTGQHPAGNYYPVAAWREGEIVPDFHLLAHPLSAAEQLLELQVAVGPPFTSAADLEWQTISQVTLLPESKINLEKTLRAQNGRTLLNGVEFPSEIRPQTPLPVTISGFGIDNADLAIRLESPKSPQTGGEKSTFTYGGVSRPPFIRTIEVNTDLPNGRYLLVSEDPQAMSVCGWLARPSSSCILGEVQISGIPLPEAATNFEDKIALLQVKLPEKELQPGGQLPITLHWQSLASMDQDYTIFLQVLDAQDKIVGQVDAWPLQGTFPTSQWSPGEDIADPYLIQLDGDLPPGAYRLQIGWYLLSTLRRLPVVDDDGLPVDDKLTITGLITP